jgi:hypothetical protein
MARASRRPTRLPASEGRSGLKPYRKGMKAEAEEQTDKIHRHNQLNQERGLTKRESTKTEERSTKQKQENLPKSDDRHPAFLLKPRTRPTKEKPTLSERQDTPVSDKRRKKRESTKKEEGNTKQERQKLPQTDDRRSVFLQSEWLSERRERKVVEDSWTPSGVSGIKGKEKERMTRAPAEALKSIPGCHPQGPLNDKALNLAEIRKSDIQAESDEEDPKEEGTKPTITRAAERRNLTRVSEADAINQKLLSKYYLPEAIDDFIWKPIPGPDDNFTPPAWLMRAVEEVAAAEVPTPRAPPVKFDLSEESVAHNSDLLKNSGLDMGSFLAANQDSTLNFGSEFRPIDELEKILGKHPNFEFFSGVLRNGMDYRFTEELSEEQRKAEVAAMIARGDHQSVQEDSEEVAKLLAKDVRHGFSIPVSPELVPQMANAMVQPAGVVKQFSLQEDGSRLLK